MNPISRQAVSIASATVDLLLGGAVLDVRRDVDGGDAEHGAQARALARFSGMTSQEHEVVDVHDLALVARAERRS